MQYPLSVDLADIGYPLCQHVARHFVAILVAELGSLTPRSAHGGSRIGIDPVMTQPTEGDSRKMCETELGSMSLSCVGVLVACADRPLRLAYVRAPSSAR